MSEKKCCVPGCLESNLNHPVLHLFPNPEKERERFNAWLMAIGGDILALSNEQIYRLRRVCHAHFEDKYCCRNNRISKIAIPTKNIPDPLKLPHSLSLLTERKQIKQIQQESVSSASTSKDVFNLPSAISPIERDIRGQKELLSEGFPSTFADTFHLQHLSTSLTERKPLRQIQQTSISIASTSEDS